MFARFCQYKKWGDYCNIRNIEVWLSLVLTVIIVSLLCLLRFYEDFPVVFLSSVQAVIMCLIGGLLGLLGIVVSGIAILMSLFTVGQETLMDNLYNKDKDKEPVSVLEKIFTSFEFLVFNLAILIIYFIGLYFAVSSSMPLLNCIWFYCVVSITTYTFLFVLFYTVSLVGNCISLRRIKNVYEEIESGRKQQTEKAEKLQDYVKLAEAIITVLERKEHIARVDGENLASESELKK